MPNWIIRLFSVLFYGGTQISSAKAAAHEQLYATLRTGFLIGIECVVAVSLILFVILYIRMIRARKQAAKDGTSSEKE